MKSLTASDKSRVVPKKFFVVMPFGSDDYSAKPTKDIAAGVLDGVRGISDKAEIIMQWYGMSRDAILAMDGPELVRLNNLSRIQYDNPDYLVSNGMAALYRIFNKSKDVSYGPKGLAGNLKDHIAISLKEKPMADGLVSECKQVANALNKVSLALESAIDGLPQDPDDRKQALRETGMDSRDLDYLQKAIRKTEEDCRDFADYAKDGQATASRVDLYLSGEYSYQRWYHVLDEVLSRVDDVINYVTDYGFDEEVVMSVATLLDVLTDVQKTLVRTGNLHAMATKLLAEMSAFSSIRYKAERGGLLRILEDAAEGFANVRTLKGLATLVQKYAQKDVDLKGMTVEQWTKLLRMCLESVGSTFSDEGEWLVKDRKLKIPPKSILWISKYPLPEDVEARRKAGETTKMDDFLHSHIENNNTMDRLIKDLNLDQRYIVRRIDKKKFDEARSKWTVRPSKLAASVVEENAPKEFRLMFHLPSQQVPDLGEQLAKGVLKGISGVTDAGPVLQLRMFSVNRNAMLIMPGQKTLQLNDMQPVAYSDPESLMADDMAVAQRLLGQGWDKRKVITRILQEAEKGPMKDWMRSWQRLDVFPEEEMASQALNSVEDMAEAMFDLSKPKVEAAIESNKVLGEEFVKDRYDPLLDFENYFKAVRSGLSNLGKGFVWEGEWLVADKTLHIPAGSRLVILDKKPNSDKAKKLIEEHNLDKRYRIQYADPAKMERATHWLGRHAEKATKERWSED